MRQHLVDTTEACFKEIMEFCADLDDAEWGIQSLCPDWTVREAIAHTVGVEDALGGWEINDREMPPFQKMADFTDASAAMAPDEFRSRAHDILRARSAELAALSDADLEKASFTPVGVQPYHRFLHIRIFDLWVHVRDCAIPLGRATDDTGPAAEIALGEVVGSIGYIAGKKIGLPDGMSMRIDLTGPIEGQIGVVVDGRAKAVDGADLADPDVVLTTESTTFIMLACGRIDPQEKIDAGAISWTGDAEWGERAARSLRFTM